MSKTTTDNKTRQFVQRAGKKTTHAKMERRGVEHGGQSETDRYTDRQAEIETETERDKEGARETKPDRES